MTTYARTDATDFARFAARYATLPAPVRAYLGAYADPQGCYLLGIDRLTDMPAGLIRADLAALAREAMELPTGGACDDVYDAIGRAIAEGRRAPTLAKVQAAVLVGAARRLAVALGAAPGDRGMTDAEALAVAGLGEPERALLAATARDALRGVQACGRNRGMKRGLSALSGALSKCKAGQRAAF